MKNNVSLFIIWIFLLTSAISGKIECSQIYGAKKYDLSIDTGSPPALIFVSDSQGNRTGADPSKGLDNIGRGSAIQEIPSSWVEQQNTESDAVNGVFVPNDSTSWDISIPDQGIQTYTINLLGVSTGVSQLSIAGLFWGKPRIPKIIVEQNVLITKGATKLILVSFDPTSRSISSTPLVNAGDFLKDTQAACGLGSISPPEACEALEDVAAKTEKAKTKGDSRLESETLERYLSILNRLHNWGQKGYRQDWDDFKDHSEFDHLRQKDLHETKFFAKDPTYSALKLDAETMLKGLPDNHLKKHD